MRAFGFAAAAAMLMMGLPSAFALDAPAGTPAAKPGDTSKAVSSAKLKTAKSSKAATPRVAHDFAADNTKRHHTIRHPKLAAPAYPAGFGMHWNASSDRARDVRAQTIMNRTPASGGKVGLKLPF